MADPDFPPVPVPQPENALTLSSSKGPGCKGPPFDRLRVSAGGSGAARTEEDRPPAPTPPAPYRIRHDGWTAARRRAFLHALARTGCVRDACRRARISSTSAYRYRRRDTGFAAAWERALGEALPVLEAAAFERAVEGVDEPVVQGGKVVTTRKRYSDAILVTLLRRADEAAARCAGKAEPDPQEAFEELKRRLAVMHRRGCKDPDCRECNG